MASDSEFQALCDAVDSGEISLREASDEELELIIELCKREVAHEEADRERE